MQALKGEGLAKAKSYSGRLSYLDLGGAAKVELPDASDVARHDGLGTRCVEGAYTKVQCIGEGTYGQVRRRTGHLTARSQLADWLWQLAWPASCDWDRGG